MSVRGLFRTDTRRGDPPDPSDPRLSFVIALLHATMPVPFANSSRVAAARRPDAQFFRALAATMRRRGWIWPPGVSWAAFAMQHRLKLSPGGER